MFNTAPADSLSAKRCYSLKDKCESLTVLFVNNIIYRKSDLTVTGNILLDRHTVKCGYRTSDLTFDNAAVVLK